MSLAVVILAGGEGRRIGGGKPLRRLGGERLIHRSLAQARLWSDVVAVAVRDPVQLARVEAELVRDDPEIEGPLGGLAAAASFAAERERKLVVTIPADMPFLPADLASRLGAALTAECGAAVASSGGQLHPVCALWRVEQLAAIPAYAASGRRSLRGLADAVGFVVVEWPDRPRDPFFNINSPADLAAAERMLG